MSFCQCSVRCCVLFVCDEKMWAGSRLPGVSGSSQHPPSLTNYSRPHLPLPSTSSAALNLFSHKQHRWKKRRLNPLCVQMKWEWRFCLCVLRQIVWFAETSISIMSGLCDPLSLVLTLSLALSPATCVAICSRLMWVTSSNWSICSSRVHPLLWHTNI